MSAQEKTICRFRRCFAHRAVTIAILYSLSSILVNAVEYDYDGAGRLIGVDWGNGKVTAYSYDANGNITRKVTAAATNADLVIRKDTPTTSTSAGIPVSFTITVTNRGPDTASGVTVTDQIPFGMLEGPVGSPSQGTCTLSNRIITCEFGIIPSGGVASVVIQMAPALLVNITNTASVSADQADSVLTNNFGSDAVAGTTPSDNDLDGMANWWETLYGLNAFSGTGSQGANGDPDGDGVTNIREFFADTNPNSVTSFLEIEDLSINSPVQLQFRTSAIRQYDVDYNDTLTNGAGWIELSGNILGNGAITSVVDSAAATNRAYRLEAETP